MVKFYRSVLTCSLCIGLTLLVACSVTDRVSYEDGEGALPDKFLADIKKDKTQKSWILSQLGEPTSLVYVPDGKEIYTYRLTRSHYKNANLLVVLRYSGVERDVKYLHLIFTENIVRKHWVDDYSVAQEHLLYDPKKFPERKSVTASRR